MTSRPREWKCSFFKDKNLEEEIELADLGEVWAGEEGLLVIYLKNEERGKVREITYKTEHENVSIIGPKELDPKEVGSLSIRWSPDIDVEEGLLDDLVVEGTLVF